MKTYQSEISRIENLYDQGDTKNTVSECGILIEHVVQMIFLDFHNHLTTPEERKKYLDLEIKWGTDYTSFIRRPTIGVSLRYYNQLLNAFPEHIRIVPEIKDDFNIVNTLRNQVAHAGSAPPSDNDAYRSLRSTKKIINKLNMLQDESDNIFGLPLHIYLVYSSIKEKFKDAKNEADFEKIVSDADILLPELMNETIARRYIHFSDDQKNSLVEIFMKNGNCDLDFKSCHEFFIGSGIIDIYGNDASELKDVFEDILMSKDNNSKKTRMSSRPYVSAMNIMFNELSSTNAEKYHVLADRIKAHYLNDNQIDDQEKNALMENARMLNIDFETLDIFINNVVNEIEKHLIKYRTFVSETADTDSGDSEVENNLINMIKLGTPFEAVRALAAQLGYNGDLDKLFSKHSPVGKSSAPDPSVSSSEDKPRKKREGAKRFSMEEGNYSDKELEDALKEYFSPDGKTEGKIERRIKVRSYLKILLSEDRPFKRDELKQIINEKGLWLEAHERSGSSLGYSGYVGNQMSHVSKEFSNKNNDFLRQIISFDSLARAEVKAGEAGAKKDTFYLKSEYRKLIGGLVTNI